MNDNTIWLNDYNSCFDTKDQKTQAHLLIIE